MRRGGGEAHRVMTRLIGGRSVFVSLEATFTRRVNWPCT